MKDAAAFERLSVNLPADLVAWLRERAAANGETKDIFLERLLSLVHGRRLVLSTGEKLALRRTIYRA